MITILLVPVPITAVTTDVPKIVAPVAIVIDFETGEVLYARNEHSLRVPASMTKLVTALVVYEEIASGRLALDTMIRVSEDAYRISTDSNMQGSRLPLQEGTYMSVDRLLHLIMLPSSNGACVTMADHISGSEYVFAYRMNDVAQRVGGRSYFTNSHGALPHYTTAYTMAQLVKEFIYRFPDILRITSAVSMNDGGTIRNNTNLLVRPESEFYFRYADGFRTGTTVEAGFCLASTAYRDGRRVIAVVMGTQNNQERYGDTITLLEWGLQESARRYAERITIVVGEYEVTVETPARLINNRAMVSKCIFTVLGAKAEWDEIAQTITATTENGNIIVFTIGEYNVLVDGEMSQLDVSPQMVGNIPIIPVRVIAESMGRGVQWDTATRTVYIN